MRILAIDTATECCSAALLIGGRLLSRDRLLERGHAEHLLPMVDELLAEAAMTLADLSAIAFGRGPGAFTGVRLAASVTQGLAYGAGVPVVPISDLRAIAQRALEEEPGVARVLVCADARMREVYWACFERGPQGYALALGDEQVGPPERVTLPADWTGQGRGRAQGSSATDPATEPSSAGAPLALAGSGFAAYPALRAVAAAGVAVVREGLRPHAREIVILAAPEVGAGRVLPPEQALPHYLRDDVTHTPHARSLN